MAKPIPKANLNAKRQLNRLDGPEADSLKKLLFGQETNKKLPDSWYQGFMLNPSGPHDMFWGTV